MVIVPCLKIFLLELTRTENCFCCQKWDWKTSILNILSGKIPQIQVRSFSEIHIAYLSQEENFDPSMSIEDTIFAHENKIFPIVKQYELALQNSQDKEAYQEAFELMEQHNAWDFETQYRQVLSKLKLNDLDRKVGTLSGGQKKRLSLAIVLINKPDVLMLDEPTNHLDLEMIEWLETFFAREKITLFMVTHDRYFLERVCTEIMELDQGELYRYKGNYSYFLEKEERIAQRGKFCGEGEKPFKRNWTGCGDNPKQELLNPNRELTISMSSSNMLRKKKGS